MNYSAEYSASVNYIRQNIRLRQKSIFGAPLIITDKIVCYLQLMICHIT